MLSMDCRHSPYKGPRLTSSVMPTARPRSFGSGRFLGVCAVRAMGQEGKARPDGPTRRAPSNNRPGFGSPRSGRLLDRSMVPVERHV